MGTLFKATIIGEDGRKIEIDSETISCRELLIATQIKLRPYDEAIIVDNDRKEIKVTNLDNLVYPGQLLLVRPDIAKIMGVN